MGAALCERVRILLKIGAPDEQLDLSKIIHQARVRRRAVVQMIIDAKRRGHRAFARLSEQEVEDRAAGLPEDGVPPEIVRVIGADDSLDKLQPQKAATPVDGRTSEEHAFDGKRPQAVVQERSSASFADINEARLHALETLVDEFTTEEERQSSLAEISSQQHV